MRSSSTVGTGSQALFEGGTASPVSVGALATVAQGEDDIDEFGDVVSAHGGIMTAVALDVGDGNATLAHRGVVSLSAHGVGLVGDAVSARGGGMAAAALGVGEGNAALAHRRVVSPSAHGVGLIGDAISAHGGGMAAAALGVDDGSASWAPGGAEATVAHSAGLLFERYSFGTKGTASTSSFENVTGGSAETRVCLSSFVKRQSWSSW